MTPETFEMLRKARVRVIQGWCQGTIGDIRGDGAVCAFGALAAVVGDTEQPVSDALWALEDEAGVPRTRGFEIARIASWNDAPGRTHAEVVALFDRVLLKHGRPRKGLANHHCIERR